MRRGLVIDDEDVFCRLAAGAFADAGFVADVAHDFESARTLASARRYDVVLVDHHLGDTLGHEALEDLIPHVAHAEVIVLTANPSPEVHDRYRRSGFQRVLAKPVSRGTLAREIVDAFVS